MYGGDDVGVDDYKNDNDNGTRMEMIKMITLDILCRLFLAHCYTALLAHFGTGSEAPDLCHENNNNK